MRAILLKTQEGTSKFGGKFYYAFFKSESGKSYRSCLYPNFGNFKRWAGFIGRKEVVLDNLIEKGNMVDADSFPKEVKDLITIGT
jgi:hypothetical protein